MGGKNAKKRDNYVAEIKQENYDKLKDYIAIDNNGEYKSTKAFRLKKKMVKIQIFSKKLMKVMYKTKKIMMKLILNFKMKIMLINEID